MSRLIDADKLRGCPIVRPHTREDMKALMCCSELISFYDIPTAYDTDEVIKQLEEYSFEDPYGDSLVDLRDAIEIVKKGGKE